MLRKDYLLSMMEELTSAVASVLGLRRENKHVEALKQLDDLLNKQFRLRSDLLRRLPPEQIIELFRMGPGMEADELQQVARILEEEAVIYMETSRIDEGIRILMKSLHLYLYSDLNGANRDLQVLPERIACIVQLVHEYELSPETSKLLAVHYERENRLDQAADVWFGLAWEQPELGSEAEAFYSQLLDKADAELERGGISRREIIEGLSEITQLHERK
ncbi:DUF6483 family protein [Paenibacillus sp. P2(2022)]|uniref:Tetratricopeptide repeat protein n=1 Tax=Paenibacillus polymyxa TaxID=1406 RepID=A0A378Y3B0_PAEPO|nr:MULTISPECIES: DUF6483 family protein [Paenibacillus]AUS28509.1 hypothetical protein C1A50_4378 [Paenibacillus polymyxa]KJK29274.1 hypothetical protein TY89_19465 [Paenibacillus polymyxa]MBE7900372.1 hypothetical protein [Paenibacillus polymyxa]MBG9764739.1 hypothetical protein [Paenibacillus polymyxa]MCC3260066.1 DUF6483 family protein [Paenibacillus polymyxa]